MTTDHKSPDTKFLLGFFLGGIIGALVIFFMGTKEGKKTAKLLEKKGKDFVDDLQDKLDDLEDQGKQLVKQGEALKEEVVEKLEDEKDTITREASERIDSALAHIEEIQDRGRKTTAHLRAKFKNLPKNGRR